MQHFNNYIGELKAIRENSPWYYRFTRAIWGLDKKLIQQEQEFQDSLIKSWKNEWDDAPKKQGPGTALNSFLNKQTDLLRQSNRFTRFLLGLKPLKQQYSDFRFKVEDELQDAMRTQRKNDIQAEIHALEKNQSATHQSNISIVGAQKLKSGETIPVKRGTHALLDGHLKAQADFIQTVPKESDLSLHKPKSVYPIHNETKPDTIPPIIDKWNDGHGHYWTAIPVKTAGKPANYANMRDEVLAVEEKQRELRLILQRSDPNSPEHYGADNRYDSLEGVANYVKGWINQLWRKAAHVEVDPRGRPQVKHPFLREDQVKVGVVQEEHLKIDQEGRFKIVQEDRLKVEYPELRKLRR